MSIIRTELKDPYFWISLIIAVALTALAIWAIYMDFVR